MPTFAERKADRARAYRNKVTPQTLLNRLGAALNKLLEHTEELGSLPTSYGWNEVDNKRAAARNEYDAALAAIKEALENR